MTPNELGKITAKTKKIDYKEMFIFRHKLNNCLFYFFVGDKIRAFYTATGKRFIEVKPEETSLQVANPIFEIIK